MKVAYLGPPGTVSDEALTGVAPEAEGVPLATLRDVVLAVQERRIERALVPIENALEGGVDPVLDCLALEAPDVSLVGEIVQPVSYCLAEHLPRAAVVPAASTAEAVRIVAEEPTGTRAAIGPRLAARHYRAVTLA